MTARVDELFQGFLDYKELFEEIKSHYTENKKVLDILNAIFQALGMQIISPNNKQNNNSYQNSNQLNAPQVISNNQSNVNLFEGFVTTENKNTNLIGNDLFANNNNNNPNQVVSSNIDLFSLNSVNTNNSNEANNVTLFGFGNNNVNFNNNISNENKQHNEANLLNMPVNPNASSNSNKTFSFIKNKNSSSDNKLINVQNFNNNLFNNLNTAPAFQSPEQGNNNINANPNDFTDLFGALKLNSANNKKNLENKTQNTLINNNFSISQQESNTANSCANSKKGFSFIKKEKQQANSNGIYKHKIIKTNKIRSQSI